MPNFLLSEMVDEIFGENIIVTPGQIVPETKDVTFGNTGTELELAMLFIDIDQSTLIVDGLRRKTAAKMYKAFLEGVARIVKENDGEVRSFNGDGVLAVFAGSRKRNNSVKAAMMMVYFMDAILKPKVDAIFAQNQAMRGFQFGYGIGIDVGNILIVKGGYRGDNNNDLVWVGDATNRAVKYSKRSNGDNKIHISKDVFGGLNDDLKFVQQTWLRLDMWTLALASIYTMDEIYTTRYHWEF